MGKSDFSKVEKVLDEGLLKMTKEELLRKADAISSKTEKIPSKELRLTILQAFDRDLKKIYKENQETYKKIGFQRQNLKKLLSNPDLLTPQDWQEIQKARSRIEKFKKELLSKLPISSNEEIIEEQRISQQKARFNVNKKWLPLK